MLLKDVLNSLIRTELNNIAIGKPEWWAENNNFNYVNLIDAISQGYLELHKRFMLKKHIVRITPLLTRYKYPLELQYAVSDPTVTDKFIIDTVDDPFTPDSICKIDTVLDKCHEPLKFNTTTFKDLVTVIDNTTLYISDPSLKCHPELAELTVVCRGLPKPIKLDDESDLEDYDLDLPYQYLEALLCYAAGKMYSNRGAENATNNESAIAFARFEAAVFNIDILGLNDREELVNERLSLRGFV